MLCTQKIRANPNIHRYRGVEGPVPSQIQTIELTQSEAYKDLNCGEFPGKKDLQGRAVKPMYYSYPVPHLTDSMSLDHTNNASE